MKLFNILLIAIILVSTKVGNAQERNLKKFDINLVTNNKYGLKQIKAFSKSTNAYNFMTLGYFINANNLMFLKTLDKKYLDNNLAVIKPILIDDIGSSYRSISWKIGVSKGNANYSSNGNESIVFEGYFFRYVGEFLDIINKRNLYTENRESILNGLKYSFSKWREISVQRYGDNNSLLFHLEMHTGANWATTALYLAKYDVRNISIYQEFIDKYDQQLSKSLRLKSENGKKYWIWDSTYPDKFSALLKTTKNYPSQIQDVSHGNHVVVYLLKAKELNNRNWSNFNLDYLINTLELKIFKNGSFADNVDGTSSKIVKNKSTGWKQTDGWMKLIEFRPSLKKYYLAYYNVPKNKKVIDNSMLGLQFFANLQ